MIFFRKMVKCGKFFTQVTASTATRACMVANDTARDLINAGRHCTVLPPSANKCTFSIFGSQTFLNLTKFLWKISNICDIKLLYY